MLDSGFFSVSAGLCVLAVFFFCAQVDDCIYSARPRLGFVVKELKLCDWIWIGREPRQQSVPAFGVEITRETGLGWMREGA
jgi:hypothetical protein